MSASGNKINYNIRTAKSVERRMVMDVVKSLLMYDDIKKCRYIGFGSPYFTDFRLYHKELHISNMLSFEIDESQRRRVEFNKPFKCINIKIGKSTNLLPYIDWTEYSKDFIWMDYDNELDYSMFLDCETIFRNVQAGSIYLITCNKQLSKYSENIDIFNEDFGDIAPIDINNKHFTGESDFSTIRRMFLNKIGETLSYRNSGLPENEKLVFRQLFFFTYKDGAPMVCFGGLLDFLNSGYSLKKRDLDKYDFIRTGEDRYIIDPPNLTYKEIHLLNSYLPDSPNRFENKKSISFIPKKELTKYRKLYKYLPNYMDVLS